MLDIFKARKHKLRIAIENPDRFEELNGYHGYWLPFDGRIYLDEPTEVAARSLALGHSGHLLVQDVIIYHQRSFEQLKAIVKPEHYLAAVPDFAQSSLQLIEIEAEDPRRRDGAGFTAYMVYLFLTMTAKEALKEVLTANMGRKDRLYVLSFDAPRLDLAKSRQLAATDDRDRLEKRLIPAQTFELTELFVSKWSETGYQRTVDTLRTLTLR